MTTFATGPLYTKHGPACGGSNQVHACSPLIQRRLLYTRTHATPPTPTTINMSPNNTGLAAALPGSWGKQSSSPSPSQGRTWCGTGCRTAGPSPRMQWLLPKSGCRTHRCTTCSPPTCGRSRREQWWRSLSLRSGRTFSPSWPPVSQ